MQVASAVDPVRVHDVSNDPGLEEVSANDPVGVIGIPGDVSDTVTVQDDDWPVVIV